MTGRRTQEPDQVSNEMMEAEVKDEASPNADDGTWT